MWFIKITVFVLIWVLLGQLVIHFTFPELQQQEGVKQALPWLLAIGYIVGSIGDAVAEGIETWYKGKE